MFMEDQYTKFVDVRFPRNDDIRRIENGSIDYDHYLNIGREVRGAAFRDTAWSTKGLIRRLFHIMFYGRSASQDVEQSAVAIDLVEPVEQHVGERDNSDYQADQSLSEVA